MGGTGFYIQALLYDIDFTENDGDTAIRRELEKLAQTQGAGCLHQMLQEIDPESAAAIHQNNVKRVIRAIEFYRQTGNYVLDTDRKTLYERIDRRVDLMMEHGLVDEVKHLADMGCTRDMVSMQGLGYKEILDYLSGEIPLEEAVYILKRDTRHFAKRQITWFKRERDVRWLELEQFQNDRKKVLEHILDEIEGEGIR